MAFEGTPINIPLKGIVRAGADNQAEPGCLNEAINLEYKDGSFYPYLPNKMSVDMPVNTSVLRIHKTNRQSNAVAIIGDKLYWKPADKIGDSQYAWSCIDAVNTLTEIQFVGNVICTDKLNYYIWNNTENNYMPYLEGDFGDTSEDGYTDLPTVDFSVTSKCGDSEESAGSAGEILFKNSVNFSSTDSTVDIQGNSYTIVTLTDSAAIALVTQVARAAQYSVQDYGRFYGYFLVTYAYRLLNGDYIMASSPRLMGMPNYKYRSQNAIYLPMDACTEKTYVESGVSKVGFDFRKGFSGDDTPWSDGSVRFDNFLYKVVAGDTEGDYNIRSAEENVDECCPLFAYYHNGWASKANFFVAGAVSNKLGIKISADIPEKYKDVIDCLCVFVSPQVNPYKDFNKDNTHVIGERFKITQGDSYFSAGYEFDRKPVEDVLEEIKALRTMYLIDEIPFEDIKQSEDWEYHNYKGKLSDTLYTLTSLPVVAFNRRQNVSGHIDTYNNRLHLFGYTQRLFNGYRLSDFLSNQYGKGQSREYEEDSVLMGSPEYVIRTKIVSSEGTSYVVRRYHVDSIHDITIGPMITYPDVNATSMEIYLHIPLMPTWKKFTIKLTRNSALGYAYFLTPWLGALNLLDMQFVPEGMTVEDYTGEIPDSSNTTMYYSNGLKTSDAKYPTYFPVEGTQMVGDGEIVGLAPLAVALSQDAFGRNPMLALCSDGVYALTVDPSGILAYSNCTPYPSREVCLNRKSICKIDGAVIFISDKGLVLLDGANSKLMLPQLIGTPRNTPKAIDDTNASRGLRVYKKLITTGNIVNLDTAVSTDDFLTYAKNEDTVVSYVSEKNKLLVFNANYKYSYLIDIPTQITTKIDVRIDFGDGNYPHEEYYSIRDESNIARKYTLDYLSSEEAIPVLVQTRPIRINVGTKSVYRTILESGITGCGQTEAWADMLVLGSLDGDNWQVIGLKERLLPDKPEGKIHEFGAVTDRVGIKYIMVVFAGKLDRTSNIDGIGISFDNKYNNKLKQ